MSFDNWLKYGVRKGLSKLETKPIPPRGKNISYPLGTVLGDYIYINDKPGGVEPGFLGVELNKNFLERVNAEWDIELKNAKECKDFFSNFFSKQISKEAQEKLEKFIKTIEKEGKSINSKVELMLIKQDYNDSKSGVSPPKNRLKQTKAVKSFPGFLQGAVAKIYKIKRKTESSKENTNAILECYANDVARSYGMEVQDQFLIFGTYQNNRPKILTACKWEPAMAMIDEKLLKGSKKESYANYLVSSSGTVNDYYLADKSITNLGECLALFIGQGDRDAFGSSGQNKGRKEGRLFGFDFGHAYRESNALLKTLKDDFSFEQPDSKYSKFKNFSICYDTSLSERMAGMFFFYKMVDEEVRDKCFNPIEKEKIDNAIAKFCTEIPGFRERYNKVEANSFANIDRQYQQKFTQLADEESKKAEAVKFTDKAAYKFHLQKSKEYKEYVASLETVQEIAKETHTKMFNIFKNRMQLSPTELDLLDHLEKFTSKTRLTANSKKDKVVLEHLRILPGERVAWQMEKNEKGDISLVSDNMSAKAFDRLQKFFKDHESIYPGLKNILDKNLHHRQLEIRINIPSHAKQDIINLFAEKNIIAAKPEKEVNSQVKMIHEKIVEQKASVVAHHAKTKNIPSMYALKQSNSFLQSKRLETLLPKKLPEKPTFIPVHVKKIK